MIPRMSINDEEGPESRTWQSCCVIIFATRQCNASVRKPPAASPACGGSREGQAGQERYRSTASQYVFDIFSVTLLLLSLSEYDNTANNFTSSKRTTFTPTFLSNSSKFTRSVA